MKKLVNLRLIFGGHNGHIGDTTQVGDIVHPLVSREHILIGAGKDTAADYLVNYHGFRRDSFANTKRSNQAKLFISYQLSGVSYQ